MFYGELIFHGRDVQGGFLGVCVLRVRMSMQDYKSLRAAVTICATLVNTHTHTDTRGRLSTGTISASLAKNRGEILDNLLTRLYPNLQTSSVREL